MGNAWFEDDDPGDTDLWESHALVAEMLACWAAASGCGWVLTDAGGCRLQHWIL
jgi:hypothetical protein